MWPKDSPGQEGRGHWCPYTEQESDRRRAWAETRERPPALRPACTPVHGPACPLTPTRPPHSCSCVCFSHMRHRVPARGRNSPTTAHTRFLISFCNGKTTMKFENRVSPSTPSPGPRTRLFPAFLTTCSPASPAHRLHRGEGGVGDLGPAGASHTPAPRQASSVSPVSLPLSVPAHSGPLTELEPEVKLCHGGKWKLGLDRRRTHFTWVPSCQPT